MWRFQFNNPPPRYTVLPRLILGRTFTSKLAKCCTSQYLASMIIPNFLSCNLPTLWLALILINYSNITNATLNSIFNGKQPLSLSKLAIRKVFETFQSSNTDITSHVSDDESISTLFNSLPTVTATKLPYSYKFSLSFCKHTNGVSVMFDSTEIPGIYSQKMQIFKS